jgi:aldose 1-epimerase
MKIGETHFGMLEGNEVRLYTLENNNGIRVKISSYGATITSIVVPGKERGPEDIVCGFNTFENYFSKEYQDNAPYFGGTIGRYCSQIKDSKFSLNGTEFQLAQNCGTNNLHGGREGFDKKIWEIKSFKQNASMLGMKLQSAHLEEGFPGNVYINVTFSLDDENRLRIDYKALTDQDTPFSMTNHTYFNLSGFAETVEGHTVQINSDRKQIWDSSGAGTGESNLVAGSQEDLRSPKIIGDAHKAIGDGFEHYYLFGDKGFALEKVAEIKDPKSGRSLEVSTTEPGMLFYTGKYTSNDLKRESGQQYGKYRGFCCETHRYPNGPNLTDSPKSILKKGESFDSTTIFKFGW